MSNAEQLANFARRQLAPILQLSGDILYSSADTLRPGPVYLLGINPGGDPDERLASKTIGASLDALPVKKTNNYLDDCWDRAAAGQSKLQLRVKWLLQQLGHQPRNVTASNLIFPRSRSEAGCNFDQFAELC